MSVASAAVRVAGDVTLDFEQRIATKQGAPVRVGPREWQVLWRLWASAGRTVTVEAIAEYLQDHAVRDGDPVIDEWYVRVYVYSIRRKLGREVITTHHRRFGVTDGGYALALAAGGAS